MDGRPAGDLKSENERESGQGLRLASNRERLGGDFEELETRSGNGPRGQAQVCGIYLNELIYIVFFIHKNIPHLIFFPQKRWGSIDSACPNVAPPLC